MRFSMTCRISCMENRASSRPPAFFGTTDSASSRRARQPSSVLASGSVNASSTVITTWMPEGRSSVAEKASTRTDWQARNALMVMLCSLWRSFASCFTSRQVLALLIR